MFAVTPQALLDQVAQKARALRLARDLTQAGLAARAGVSVGSLKRFEQTGQISLESLVKIAFVLGAERGFETLFAAPEINRLDEALDVPRRRQRGRRS